MNLCFESCRCLFVWMDVSGCLLAYSLDIFFLLNKFLNSCLLWARVQSILGCIWRCNQDRSSIPALTAARSLVPACFFLCFSVRTFNSHALNVSVSADATEHWRSTDDRREMYHCGWPRCQARCLQARNCWWTLAIRRGNKPLLNDLISDITYYSSYYWLTNKVNIPPDAFFLCSLRI